MLSHGTSLPSGPLVHRIYRRVIFFLWGFVKGNVFTTPPASIEDMRDRIVNELTNLREDPEMIKKGVQGYAEAR